jgi:hypothetical protein
MNTSQLYRKAAETLAECERTYEEAERQYHAFRTTEGRKLREQAYANLQKARTAYRQLVHK